MLALEVPRRFGHGRKIKRVRFVLHVAPQEWRHHASAKNAIPVSLGQRVPPRMKLRPDLLRFDDADRGRQQRVAGPLKIGRAQRRGRMEIRDLPGSMHSRVRAARAENRRRMPRQFFQDVGQRPLNGRLSRLNLPAAEIGAVIGKGEFDISHFRYD